MTKKIAAFLLAAVLLVGISACGDDTVQQGEDTTTTTVTTQPNASGGTDSSSSESVGVTQNGGATDAVRPSASGGAASSTVPPAPTGATVPIGTKPPITTTTVQSATGTTVTLPTDGSTTGSVTTTITTTTTATTATTTTAPTVRPTEPEVQGPYIVLPAIGSDIDVTNKKNRIRVSDVAAWFEDNVIGIQLTFKNYTSNWITEETDYVQYTCYDKDGKVVQRATKLMIGVIDTKNKSVKTFTFDVPANTAEVRITNSKITYWTEWA